MVSKLSAHSESHVNMTSLVASLVRFMSLFSPYSAIASLGFLILTLSYAALNSTNIYVAKYIRSILSGAYLA